MRVSTCVLAALAIVPLAQTANAAIWTFDWAPPQSLPNGSINHTGGQIKGVSGKYDTVTQILTWDVKVAANTTDAITLAVSDGEQPRGNGGEYAQVFYDGTNVTAYAYNGKHNTSSYRDGNGNGVYGDQDTIASSLVNGSWVLEHSKTQSGDTRTFHLMLDVSGINAHVPDYPDQGGDPWHGMGFTDKIGVWVQTFDNADRGAVYKNKWLEKWDYKCMGWLKTECAPTVPTPGTMALVGASGLLLIRRRRGS